MDGMQFEMVMLHGGMKAHGAEKNGGERERERERERECTEKDHIVAGSKSNYIREKGFHHLSGGGV